MANVPKSRRTVFSRSSYEEGSSSGSNLPPLQVEKGVNIDFEQRIKELSQDESPPLRRLAQRLGEDFHIETPRCENVIDKHPYAEEYVGERWEEYQGCKNWEGLLEPDFDRVLKAEVLRYGEFAQATYDAFDNKKESKGTCKYTKADLLRKVGLPNRGYEITNFIYATTNFRFRPFFTKSKKPRVEDNSKSSDDNSEKGYEDIEKREDENENSKQCNWMGFVAVCTSPEEIARLGRRDIVVAWRGSMTMNDWITDFTIHSEDFVCPSSEFKPHDGSPGVRVHKGFKHIYESTNIHSRYNQKKSAQVQVSEAVQALVKKYQDEGKLSISITGHSLGSALATLCAYHIAEDRLNISGSQVGENTKAHGRDQFDNKFLRDRPPISLYSFGGPRVGNKAFKDRMEELGVAVLRVVNKHDVVTKLPGLLNTHLQKKLKIVSTHLPIYEHVGVARLKLFNDKSEFLQKTGPLEYLQRCSRSHSLETYLHLVDSYQGIKEDYQKKKKTIRDHLHRRDSHQGKEDKYKAYERTFRDHAFVNKHQDFLLPKYRIPKSWWQVENKGLEKDESGYLKLPKRDRAIPRSPEP